MDWRNYQFWRKSIHRMDEKKSEFDILIQRTKQRIVLGEQLRNSLRLLQGTSEDFKRVSKREIVLRKLRNLQQNIPFFKKFR